jgi:hypothetical protein
MSAGPGVHRSLDDNLASAHRGSQVHPNISLDRHPAAGHPLTDAFDVAQITPDHHVIRVLAFHCEEIVYGHLATAPQQRQGSDLGPAPTDELVRR